MNFFAKRFRFSYLLFSMVLLLFTYPYLSDDGLTRAVRAALYTGILFTAIRAVGTSTRQTVLGLVLGSPYLVAVWANIFAENTAWNHLAGVSGVVFFLYVFVILFSGVVRAPKVTTDVIYGALCCYLLLGICWAHAYALLDGLDPEAFRGIDVTGPLSRTSFADFLYYSFVTLTTLGYGDVLPVSEKAKSLALMEAVTGVIFVAVQIARLVGMHQPEED